MNFKLDVAKIVTSNRKPLLTSEKRRFQSIQAHMRRYQSGI